MNGVITLDRKLKIKYLMKEITNKEMGLMGNLYPLMGTKDKLEIWILARSNLKKEFLHFATNFVELPSFYAYFKQFLTNRGNVDLGSQNSFECKIAFSIADVENGSSYLKQ